MAAAFTLASKSFPVETNRSHKLTIWESSDMMLFHLVDVVLVRNNGTNRW